MKKFFFKYCLGIPPEEEDRAAPQGGGGETIDKEVENEYNKFIRAIEYYDICEIRRLKKDNEKVQKILDLISTETPEYRMLYLVLVSIIRDFDNPSSNLGLKKFIMELLYLDCKSKVNNTMLKIVKRANCILKDDKVMCYKSDILHAYLITLDTEGAS